MVTKLQFYSELSERSTKQLTKSRENWTEYLTTAARLYKYPFDEQVMIYAQRPDATACAPLETWNDPMNRRVKRGSKGIALIYEMGGRQRLRYVFDYADTEDGRRDPKRPFIWELKKEHEVPVMDALVKAYGDMEGTLAEMLHNIAYDFAEDYYNNNANDIAYSLKDSFLEDYDEDNIRVAFREAITVSTAYSIMSRCGLDPNEYFEDEDFNCIFDFNTQDTVTTLGMAVSELSEQILREIETTIKKYERNKTAERSTDYGSGNLNVQQERRLYASQSNAERSDGGTDREIRANAAELHQKPPQDTLHVPASERGIDPSLGRNRPDSGTPLRAVDERIDGEEPAAEQGDRSDGMGSAHERPESASGGIYTGRTDLQLDRLQGRAVSEGNDQPNQTEGAADETAPFSMAELAQLHTDWNEYLKNAIIREETVLNAVINSDRDNTITEIEAAVKRIHSAISQDILNSTTIQNKGQRADELDNYFNKDRKPPLAEQLYDTVIRSEEYKERLAENTPKPIFISDDNDVHSMDLSAYRDGDIIGYNAKGVEFSLMRMGDHTFITNTTKITPWGEILGAGNIPADIIKQIRIANGHEAETATPPEQETAEIGDTSLSGQPVEQKQSENIPERQEYKYYSIRRPVDIGTYPREINPSEIVNFDSREPVEDGAFEAWGYLVYPQPLTDAQIQDYELRAAPGNPDLQAEKNGSQIGVNLSDEQELAPLSEIIEQSGISLDAVDVMLRDGGNKNNSVMRITAHYMKDKTPAENAEFLAREYGNGGKGLRIDNQRYTSWFDETGITIAEGPSALYAMRSVHLTWAQVESRVRELLYNGQYLPQNRLDAVPDFERKELADKLWYLRQDTDKDEYEFFIDGGIFRSGFPDSTERIAELLSQPEQLNNVIEGLRSYCDAYVQDPFILHYRRLHNPQELLQRLSDLRIPPVVFTANEIPSVSCVPFVTEDDIENVLSQGSRVSEGKFRIYSYFLHEHTSKEKADFLKKEYGTGGSSHAIYRADNSHENHDSKGIEISRGSTLEPRDSVLIPWSRAARLIDELINTGNYMTRAEIDRIPDYEKQMLGASIIGFYRDLPEDIPRPVPIDNSLLGDYWGNARAIGNMLDNPDTVSEILTAMRPIWEVTPPEDRYYNARQKAYADLTAYRDGTFTLFPQLSAVAMQDAWRAGASWSPRTVQSRTEAPTSPEDNITAPRQAALFEPPRGQSEQLTLFSLPTEEEQQAVISKAEEKRHNAAQQSSAFSMPVVEQSDIDAAICRWNGNLDSKIMVYEYMREHARAREAANLLKEEYGGGLHAFTVEKDGAEPVTLPWPKVQKRIAQLMDDGKFLTPEEQEYTDTELQKVRDNPAAENAVSEADGSDDQPVMVVDNIARNNYNLFALAFPQIVNGTYRSMTFKNEENKHELSISHDTTNAGLIHFDISYYKPDGTEVYDPMMTLEANFENRMLKPIQYANTLSGEDIGLLSIPSSDDAQRLDALGVGVYELLAGIKNQGFMLLQADVFHDAEGKPLPAEPKQNIEAFLKEQADRESAAHDYVTRNMPGVAAENNQQQEQTAEPVSDNVRYLRSRVIITEFSEGEVVTAESLITEAVNAPQSDEPFSHRVIAGKVLQDVYGQRTDPIDYFNRNYASGYDFTEACIIRGYIETAVYKDTLELRALPESERMPRPFPITSREWESVDASDKEDSPYEKGLLLMRNHYAELMPVVIDDANGHELHRFHYQTADTAVTGSALAYSEQEAARIIPYDNYVITSAEPMRGTPEERAAAMRENQPELESRTDSADAFTENTPDTYYTQGKNIPYREGDIVASLSAQAVINRIDDSTVYYTFVSDDDPDEYQMEKDRFEENLDNGSYRVVGPEIPAPEQSAREYAAGDTVYLENDRHFVIDRIGGSEITLHDPSLPIPVSRTIERLDFEALMRENPRNSHLLTPDRAEPKAAQEETIAVPSGMPIIKTVVDTFSQLPTLYYAKHTDGSLYISNGYYMMRTTEQDLASLTEKINNRRRKTADIEVVENNRLLEHIDSAKGTFELHQKPYELGVGSGLSAYVYADEKQYFEYNKQYVSLFESDENRLFVNDNASYDTNLHSMVVKDRNNGILGIVLPIKVPDELYNRLADVLPLEVKRKSEIERIKENPTNDPYIGKEFFDGRENHIISGITKHNGIDMYTVPTVENGEISRSAALVRTDEIENQIARWEQNRDYAEKQKAENEIRAQKEAEIKAVYENTNGYADNFPSMQKANVLKTLNGSFSTKDYGNLNVKQFIEAAVKDGKTLESYASLKKKYAEMDANEYVREFSFNERTEAWGKYRAALTNFETEDSPNALWLKENHPFLYHKLYNDITVLDSSYTTLEYRLMMEDNVFYEIPKTAFDYGNYLINGGVLENQQREETPAALVNSYGAVAENNQEQEQAAPPRFEVATLANVAIISSNPPVYHNPKNTISYGVRDMVVGRYLKNDDETYVRFDTEAEAAAYVQKLNLETETNLSNAPIPEKTTPEKPKPQPQNRINFHITDDHLGEGGAKTKYGYNVAAIRLLKQIEAENRLATPAEQETLSRYVGWGGIAQAFDSENKDWRKEYAELQTLLTPDEYDKARASTLNAHYTSPVVIKAIYEAVERMGFKTGNILEPACGIGNFLGLLPESMQNSKMYGVELDSITGRIAKQLYQKANITINGFEKTDMPDSFFDLAIGNVPFGGYKVTDKKYDKHNFLIHDYFFAKTLDQVRPGGIVAFVTSKGTMDKQNPEVRKYIAQRAELLGAVRLPNNAFLKNAGTEVTSDILFFQKRDHMIDIQPDWVNLGVTADNVPVNSYFAEHPEMILGTMAVDDMMYGDGKETTCFPIPGADLAEQLKTALANIQGEITEPELDGVGEIAKVSVAADSTVRNYSYALVTPDAEGQYAEKIGEGEVYYRENSRMYPVDLPKMTLERIKGMIALRDCAHELIDYQLHDYSAEDIAGKQAELNRLYDDFTSKYGLINSRGNSLAFSNDSAYYLLCSLEILDENGDLDRKADMFTKRTIKQKAAVTSVDTASEALALSIAEKACIDLGFMAQLMGGSDKIEDIVNDLRGVIFKDPATGPFDLDGAGYAGWQTSDEYLSGNVRKKLIAARAAAEKHPEFAVNVEALEKVQPKDLEASEIAVKLGTTWIDKEYIQQFMYELLETPNSLQNVIQVNYSPRTGEWGVTGAGRVPSGNILANVTYGTARINAYEIIRDTLNLKDVRIYDTVEDADGKEKRVLNKKETTLAAQKQDAIKQKFKDWIWKNPERRQTLVSLYNERFNSVRPREYDGSHINFAGISPEISLRSHQLNAIAHILYGGNTLLAHEVGAGKTFEMVAAAMESKRLGLCQKSLFAVPNHLTEQTASEFLRLYPSANLLVATAKDFETKNRKKFCAKIATGDYDAVIIGHSQMEKIPMSKERQERLLNEQIWEITEGIDELKRNDGERFTIKQLEKTKKSLEARLEKLTDGSRKDDIVTFEQLGVDRLFVDEAHNFKNLFLYTKMRNVAGLSQTEAQKSSDLFMKCRYMDELTDNKGIIFATGTPISNSMTEMYTMQRYLQYETLQNRDLAHFDCWASSFGETVTAIELAPEGTGYRARTRFSKFDNLPELMCMFKEVADIKTADMLDLPRPKANFNTVVVQPTEIQKDMVKDLSERAAAVHKQEVEPHVDNMLKITSDGRKIGLDQRLINDMLPDDPGSKVNACMNNVFNIWEETKEDRLTQLIFSDFSTPNADGRFNVYDDIRAKLIEKGVPAEEIAFIHQANTETRKKELFAKVRQGKVRILLGSTFKMGSGTNVQDRLIAMHDLDCPWRPADLEQRAGRIIRQGNMNPEVNIYRYVTEGTFDAYLYQTVENKQKFISQIMSSKSPVRSCEDVDETALSYAEIKALCAGNPLIREKMDLDIEVARLRLLKADYQSQHYRLEDALIRTFPQKITKEQEEIAGYKSDIERLTAETKPNEDGFSPMEIRGVTYDEKGKAGAALLEACKKITTTEPVKIGSYRGFDMSLSFDSFHKVYHITLKGSMSYSTDLGDDTFGNITRINNVFIDLPKRLDSSVRYLENIHQQIKNAKQELETPFQFEQELAQKSERLAALDAELNMDKGGQETPEADAEVENGESAEEHDSTSAKSGKYSILEDLKSKLHNDVQADKPDKEKIAACL